MHKRYLAESRTKPVEYLADLERAYQCGPAKRVLRNCKRIGRSSCNYLTQRSQSRHAVRPDAVNHNDAGARTDEHTTLEAVHVEPSANR